MQLEEVGLVLVDKMENKEEIQCSETIRQFLTRFPAPTTLVLGKLQTCLTVWSLSFPYPSGIYKFGEFGKALEPFDDQEGKIMALVTLQ